MHIPSPKPQPHCAPLKTLCRHKRWETLLYVVEPRRMHHFQRCALVLAQLVSAGAPLTTIQQVMNSRGTQWLPQNIAG